MESRELLIPQSRGSFPRTKCVVVGRVVTQRLPVQCDWLELIYGVDSQATHAANMRLLMPGCPTPGFRSLLSTWRADFAWNSLMIKVYEASRKLAIDGSRDIDCWLDRAKANGFTHGIPTSTI
ncbi:hypothetical protein PoMZ_05204 [Pyricularia oryzae]|uniref:Uncharacterized protein n=1 Tax=Pyricularia oryzae TaxID=318829 RepID=A0A4P7NN51_PYROR|nr:hypothetical protein PoMZ_05204 [Pyricularia oryzae]